MLFSCSAKHLLQHVLVARSLVAQVMLLGAPNYVNDMSASGRCSTVTPDVTPGLDKAHFAMFLNQSRAVQCKGQFAIYCVRACLKTRVRCDPS
jgi:hypothetical protein